MQNEIIAEMAEKEGALMNIIHALKLDTMKKGRYEKAQDIMVEYIICLTDYQILLMKAACSKKLENEETFSIFECEKMLSVIRKINLFCLYAARYRKYLEENTDDKNIQRSFYSFVCCIKRQKRIFFRFLLKISRKRECFKILKLAFSK